MGKGLMQNKTFLQVISLIIAVLFWMVTVSNKDPEIVNKIEDIKIVSGLDQAQLDEGLSIISKSDETVSFSARGNRSLVTGKKGGYYASLDLSKINRPGRYTLNVLVSKPGGVTIENVTPSTVEIYVDQYLSTLVPVNIKTENALPDDYILKSITANTEQISITAPSLSLEDVAYAGINVDLSKIKKSEILECTPEIMSKDGEVLSIDGLHIDTENIKVSVDIQEVKRLKVLPALSKDMKDYDISITPEYVKVSGDIDTLKDINVISTAIIDADKIKENEEIETTLILPNGTKLLDEKDANVVISVRKEE